MQVTDPLTSARAAQPVITVFPVVNCTVPVGVDPVTVAVKLTLWPTVEGFTVDVRVVPEVTAFTVWLTESLLVTLLPSPL